MEFIEGKSLQDMVGAQNSVPLPLDKAIDTATQIAAGLQAAHEKGITHRDIKSANIMATDKGLVKIMDFGLAKLSNRSKMTVQGTTLGTAAYMSPEQAQGNTALTFGLWAWSCTKCFPGKCPSRVTIREIRQEILAYIKH